MIIDVDIYKRIRTRFSNGESIRSIASSLGIARQTVKKYCEGATHPDERKQYERQPSVITEAIQKFILNCMKEDEQAGLKKQKHTAKRIYDRLCAELEFQGSYSSIRVAVSDLRKTYVPNKAAIPLSYEPGEAVQIDWGEATIYVNNEKIKVQIFCGRLCYSCDIFVQAYMSANEETFLEAQQQMYHYFGGVPKRSIFDNAKVAVKEGFGIYAKPQQRYLSFSAHYAIALDFCNPARGNEKSLVENLVKYARNNFFVPVPRVSSLDELMQNYVINAYVTELSIKSIAELQAYKSYIKKSCCLWDQSLNTDSIPARLSLLESMTSLLFVMRKTTTLYLLDILVKR